METFDSLVLEEDEQPKGRNNEYLLVFLLAFICYLASVDAMLLMPLINEVMAAFKVGTKSATTVVSIYSFFAFLSGILSSGWVDRFDRKKALLFCFAGFTIGTTLCAFATNFYAMIGCRAITGVFGGIVGGVATAMVSDIIPYERRATAISIISLSFAVAAITGIPFAFHLVIKYDLFMPFKILAAVSGLTLLAVHVWLPNMTDHIHLIDKSVKRLAYIVDVFKDKNQVLALFLAFIIIFSHQVVILFIIPYFENNIGFDEDWVPIMYAIGGICTVITSPFIGKFSDKIGNKQSFLILMLLSFIPIYITTNITSASIPVAIVICATFFILAAGRIIPAYTIMTAATTKDKRGGFMSLRSAFLELGTAVASVVSGFVVGINTTGKVTNFNKLGYISIACGLLAIVISRFVKVVTTD
ncbi:MAG: MFS transporter [Chitinophagales bacterium]|nr:MFS transporter [Chitinophagales bacterium]